MKKNIKIIGIGGGANSVLSYFALNKNKYNIEVIASDSATCGMRRDGISKKLPLERVLPIYRVVDAVLKGKNQDLIDIQCCIGCEGNVKLGELSAKYKYNEIEKILKKVSKVVFVVSIGGGTGSGAIKVFLEIAKKLNIDVTCLVIHPFSFEGEKRRKRAETALEFIKNSNIKYFEYYNDTAVEKGLGIVRAFKKADDQASDILKDIIEVSVKQ